MTEPTHTCLLAQAHLCADGVVVTSQPRITHECYCDRLRGSELDEGQASELKWQRARAVARRRALERSAAVRQF